MDAPSKISGHKDEIIGNIKGATGQLIGNDSLMYRGGAQNAAGTAQVNAAIMKQKGEAAVNTVTGNVKSTIGNLIGHKQMHAEGEVSKAKGDIKA